MINDMRIATHCSEAHHRSRRNLGDSHHVVCRGEGIQESIQDRPGLRAHLVFGYLIPYFMMISKFWRALNFKQSTLLHGSHARIYLGMRFALPCKAPLLVDSSAGVWGPWSSERSVNAQNDFKIVGWLDVDYFHHVVFHLVVFYALMLDMWASASVFFNRLHGVLRVARAPESKRQPSAQMTCGFCVFIQWYSIYFVQVGSGSAEPGFKILLSF